MQSKRSKVLAWSVAATTGMATILVAPAAAQAAFQDCPPEVFCLWADPNGEGHSISSDAGLPDLRQHGLDDTVTSVANNSTTRGLCIYPDLNYDGAWYAYIPPFTWANIEDVNADNQITSARWAPSSNCS